MAHSILIIFILLTFVQHAAGQEREQSSTVPSVSLSYVLAVDNSGSIRSLFDQVVGAAKIIVANNNPEDETSLIRFVDTEKIEIVFTLTKDKRALTKAIDGFYIEGGRSALIDTVYLSINHIAEKVKEDSPTHRRALVLITDGEEQNSYYKQEKLVQLLREKKVRVFVLGFPELLKMEKSTKVYDKAVAFLNLLAKESGGKVFLATSKDEMLTRAGEILNAIRSQ